MDLSFTKRDWDDLEPFNNMQRLTEENKKPPPIQEGVLISYSLGGLHFAAFFFALMYLFLHFLVGIFFHAATFFHYLFFSCSYLPYFFS